MQHLTIKQWALDDRPREKLHARGAQALSDAELLSILISTGTKKESALDIAKRLLSSAENSMYALGALDLHDFTKIAGIGPAKAITLLASFEIGRRRSIEEPIKKKTIASSLQVFEVFSMLLSEISHEEFWVLYLSRNNSIISKEQISMGGVSGTVIDVKIIAKHATSLLASSMILCHNHPSGNIKPSKEDIRVTEKIKKVGEIIDCQVLDHIIVAQKKYYSFADEGIL